MKLFLKKTALQVKLSYAKRALKTYLFHKAKNLSLPQGDSTAHHHTTRVPMFSL
jgi:hypothetical protein